MRLEGQYYETEDTLLVSKVTGLLVFSRMSQVDFYIECNGNFGGKLRNEYN